MTMTDAVADMITRIRNGNLISKPDVLVPYSKMKEDILMILKESGFIKNYELAPEDKKNLKVELLYYNADRKAITEIKKISKPGSRIYVSKDKIPLIKNGKGVAILSTSKGVFGDKKAREMGVGGELLFYVW